MKLNKGFSSRHPFLFGLSLFIIATALIWGAVAFFSANKTLFHSDVIGVVKIKGAIKDSLPTVKFLRKLRKDPSIKGVLVRINSPGGTIAPSQELYHAIRKLAEVKPVVASFGTVAASGGYYAAAGATKIVANSGSITGSIGVKAEYLSFSRILGDIGVKANILTSGKLKAAGSPYAELTDEQRVYLQNLIMDMHHQFVSDVAKGRRLTVKEVEAIADGRAITGLEAKKLGLVDRIGGYEDAADLLKALCSIESDAYVVEQPEEDKPLLTHILGSLGLSLSGSLDNFPITFSY